MLACSHSPQLAEEDTILSCANILHVGAEAYGLLMPSLAPGNNIIESGRKYSKRKAEIRGRTGEVNEKERAAGRGGGG